MQTAQYSVDLLVNKQIVGTCEISAGSAEEAAHQVAQSLTLDARRLYRNINLKETIMNNENTHENTTNDTETKEETPVTAMHEVTPQDKETQEGLEDVEVGEVVPMSPASAEADKGLRPDLANDRE